MRIAQSQDPGFSPPRPVSGRDRAGGELLGAVYGRLRQVAIRLMRRERTGHTLSPTAVVHEGVIRLLREAAIDDAAGRSQLIARGVRAMRQVLIDHARRRAAGRHGGGRHRVPFDQVLWKVEEQGVKFFALHEALGRLAERNERQAQVMTLRYLGGMTVPEVAGALGVAPVTVERDWRLARAWLRGQLGGGGP